MPTGPQRSGYPNIVRTSHGQELARRSDTSYTHAVVHTEPMSKHRQRLQDQIDSHQRLIAKYGEENVEEYITKGLSKLQKTLGKLPESESHSTLVSMHTSAAQAEARRRKESNKGIGHSVMRVEQS